MKERKRESSRNKSTKGINHSRLPGSVAGVLVGSARCLVRVLTYRSFDLFRETKDTLPHIEKEKAFYSACVSIYVQLPSPTIDV